VNKKSNSPSPITYLLPLCIFNTDNIFKFKWNIKSPKNIEYRSFFKFESMRYSTFFEGIWKLLDLCVRWTWFCHYRIQLCKSVKYDYIEHHWGEVPSCGLNSCYKRINVLLKSFLVVFWLYLIKNIFIIY